MEILREESSSFSISVHPKIWIIDTLHFFHFFCEIVNSRNDGIKLHISRVAEVRSPTDSSYTQSDSRSFKLTLHKI